MTALKVNQYKMKLNEFTATTPNHYKYAPLYGVVAACERDLLYPVMFESTQSVRVWTRSINQFAKLISSLEMPSVVEDLLLTLVALRDARTARSIFSILCMYLKKYLKLDGSVIVFLGKKLCEMLPSGLQSDEEFEPSLIESFVSNFKKFKKSENSKKIYKTIMYIFSLVAFGYDVENMNFGVTYKEMFSKIYHHSSDFITVFVDGMIYLCKTGYQCYKSGSLSPIWHHDESYTEFLDDCMEVKRTVRLLYDPETHGIHYFSFLDKVDSLIEKGEAMAKFRYSDCKFERSYIMKIVNDLKMVKNDLTTKRAAQAMRQAPYSILVYGTSSVGKSTFKQILIQHYGKIFELPTGDEFIYTRNFFDKYYSGFTSSQWCIVLDDLGFLLPQKAQTVDPSLGEVIQICNNIPLVTNQADVDAKGRIPLRCRLVTGTTNVPDLNAHAYFSCPLAIQRRLPHVVTIVPKPEYRTNDMLDSSKVPEPLDGEYPDLWEITVSKVVAADANNAQLVEIGVYSDINEFLAWYGKDALRVDCEQKRILSNMELSRSIPVCKVCCYTKTLCKCQIVQADRSEEPSVWARYLLSDYAISWYAYLFEYYLLRRLFLWLCQRIFVDRLARPAMFLMGRRRFLSFNPPQRLKIFLGCITLASFCYMARQFLGGSNSSSKEEEQEDPYISEYYTEHHTVHHSIRRPKDSHYKPEEASSQGAKIGRPRHVEGERENVWYNDKIELSRCDLGQTTLGMNGREECAEDMIARNIVFIHARRKEDPFSIRQCAVCLRGNLYMGNNHLFPDEGEYHVTIKHNTPREGIDTIIKCIVDTRSLDRRPNKDLVFFELRTVPPKRDITSYIAKVPIQGMFAGTLISKKDGITTKRHVRALRIGDVHVKDLDIVLQQYIGNVDTPTSVGDCGSPLVLNTSYGPVLAGIHIVGEDHMVGSIVVTQDDISTVVFEPGIQAGRHLEDFSLKADTATHSLGSLHPKSVFRYIESGSAALLGSLSTYKASGRSRVQKSLYYRDMLALGYKDEHGAPDLATWRPWRHAALEMVSISNGFNEFKLEAIRYEMQNHIIEELDEMGDNVIGLQDIHPYDDDTVLNGEPGVNFVDKINRNTSAGFPWKTTKRKFLTKRECSTHPHCMEADAEILARSKRIEEIYASGQRVYPIFAGNLKDEALPKAKCENGKTRVFSGAPFDWTIVVRKYFLSIIRVVQNNPELFECSVGISAQSKAWHELREHMVQHGEDRVFDGDYAKFDKKMSPIIILEAFNILVALAEKSGNYDETQIRIMRGIAIDVAFPVIEFNGDLVQFFGSNPSGHPLTVIINSLANSLYMRYAYNHLCPYETVPPFQDMVTLMTYGDDNMCGVNKECTWFNHTTVQEFFATVGITYTMADKNTASVPFLHIDQISFLKRKWRFDEDLGAYVCPLEEKSIHKMLTRVVRDYDVSQELQATSILDTACREYFWYGRSVFEKKRKEFIHVFNMRGLNYYGWEGIFPEWETLAEEYKKSSGWTLAKVQAC